MEIFFILLDIITKLIEYAFKFVLYILFKVGSSQTSISYSCHSTDREKLKS